MDGRVRIGTKVDTKGVSKGLGNIKKLIAGAGIAKVMQEAISSFSTFENVLKKSETLYGDVTVSQSSLEKQMLALSSATGEAVETLGEGLYTALSAGIPVTEDMGEAMLFLETNIKLAKAGFTDVDTAVGSTSKVLNAYKMDVSEIDKVSNILISTQNKGITTVGELSQHLAQVTPIASAMGVSFEEVGAGLATMTAQGTKTAQATTQLRQTITELSKDGTVASNNLKLVAQSAGLSETSFSEMIESGRTLDEILELMSQYAEDNNIAMIDMFSSIEAGQGALALSGQNAQKFSENLDYMRNSAGLVDTAYSTMADTLKTQTDRIKSSFKNLGISLASEFGESLTGTAENLADFVTELSTTFSNGGMGLMVTKVLDSLTDSVYNAVSVELPKYLNDIPNLFGQAFQLVADYAPTLFDVGHNLIVNLARGLANTLPTVASNLVNGISEIAVAIWDRKEEWFNLGGNLLKIIYNGARGSFEGVALGMLSISKSMVTIFTHTDWKAVGSNMIDKMGLGFSEEFPKFADFAVQQTYTLMDKINGVIDDAKRIFTDKEYGYFDFIGEQWGKVIGKSVDSLELSEDEVLTSLDDIMGAVSESVSIATGVASNKIEASLRKIETIINDELDLVPISVGEASTDALEQASSTAVNVAKTTGKVVSNITKDTDGNIEEITEKIKTLGEAIKESIAGSFNMSSEEFQDFIDEFENSESVFEKVNLLANNVSDTIVGGLYESLDSVSDALADITTGTSSWSDAMSSAGAGILGSLGDVAKEMGKQLAGIAVAKALAGDWVGAGLATAGALALGYGGALLNKITEWVGGEEETEAPPTYEETKSKEAQRIQEQIKTTTQDRDRAKAMSETVTDPNDIRYFTQMYLDFNREIEELKKDLQFAQGFSTGGVVGGSSLTGDKLLAWVNSKELILNQQQQAGLSDKIGTLTSLANRGTTLIVNVNGDSFGVEDFYNKVYNGIKGLQYEGAINQW